MSDHEAFIETFETMGFDVEEDEPPEGAERGVVLAENEHGDELWWSVDPDADEWGVYIDPGGVTLDEPFFAWDDLTFEKGEVVIERATGTRSSDGYGVTGFDGEVRFDSDGHTITETTTHRS